MGLFDTLDHRCPACGRPFEIQVKPCDVPGRPQSFAIAEAPDQVLERAAYIPEFCECGCAQTIVHGPPGAGWSVRVSRDFSIKDLPERIEWKIATRR